LNGAVAIEIEVNQAFLEGNRREMNSMKQILSTRAKGIRASAIALVVVVVFSAQANAATTIGYWALDGIPSVSAALPGANAIPTSFSADTGSGTLYIAPDHTGNAGTGVKGNVDDATGTTVNTPVPNFIGPNTAEAFLNGVTGNVLVGNGGYIEVQFTMSGQSNIGVSYATYASGTSAFNNNQWSYSTDGVNFTNFGGAVTTTAPLGSNHITTGGYSLVGPLIASGLDGFSGTAYLRYTFNGASGTQATPLNRIDNLLLQSGASPPAPSNSASLPQPGDIVFGLNNSDSTNTLELVRGSAVPSGGVRYPGPWQTTPFIQSVEFDNKGGVSHNAHGNLLGVDFGATATGGLIYSMATTGSNPAPAGQLIGNTQLASGNVGQSGAGGCGAGPCLTGVTLSRLAGLSVSPDNTKVAVVGTDTGRVLVYDYTAGDSQGAGASLLNGRESASGNLNTGNTQGTTWKSDSSKVIAFSASGNLIEVDPTTMVTTDVGVATSDVTTPFLNSAFTSLAYRPDISPYLYALWSGFAVAASPQSQTRLYVFDPANNYSLLTTQVSGGVPGVDLSGSSQTGREIALDKDGNLFIGGFDSTITYLPAADFATPASIAAIANDSSTFYYGSTYDAAAFTGLDIGSGSAGLTGDYNGDGKVDAADYVIWRKTNINGAQGYTDWRTNFGNGTPGSGSSLAHSAVVGVPEPASIALLLIGLVGVCWRRRGA
jgi:hypothetical protein